MLGPPSVLNSEDAKAHNQWFSAFYDNVQPQDMIEVMLVRDATDTRAEISQLRALKPRVTKRIHEERVKARIQKVLDDRVKVTKEALTKIRCEFAAEYRERAGDPGTIKEIERLQAAAQAKLAVVANEIDREVSAEMKNVGGDDVAKVKERDKIRTHGKERHDLETKKIKAEVAAAIQKLKTGDPMKIEEENEILRQRVQERLDAAVKDIDDKTKSELEDLQDELSEVDDVAIFHEWFEVHEQIDRRLDALERKFERTLRQLDDHRHGLGQRLREAAEKTIEGEYTVETASPPPILPLSARAAAVDNLVEREKPAPVSTELELAAPLAKRMPKPGVAASGPADHEVEAA